MEYRDKPVTAVIPTKDPNHAHLAWTLERLAQQDHDIREAIIVDSSRPPLGVEVDGLNTTVIPFDGNKGEARWRGIQAASTPYIADMEEDAVFVHDDYISSAVKTVESQDDVVGAGGVTIPLRGNIEGQVNAVLERFNPSPQSTHYLVYPRQYLLNDSAVSDLPVSGVRNDIPLRSRLGRYGRIDRMTEQPVMKDMPTTRQRYGRSALGAALLGGIISGIGTSIAERILRRVTQSAEEATGLDL